MKEKLELYKEKASGWWNSYPTKTKGILIGSFLFAVIFLTIIVVVSSKSNYSPLYTNLTPAEAGEIKAAIEQRGTSVQLSADGRTISVPNEEVADLKVELAAEGLPKSGNVTYSVFSDNMGLGMTDRHFDVVERDAMQNELAFLIRQINGISDANVMITLPKENFWLSDDPKMATASVVITNEPWTQLDPKQVNGLYHLISKSIPNLPPDQIVIMDQNGQSYRMQDENQLDTTLSIYQQQREIRKDIEQDIQRELQQMLGLILGRDKVVVSVMASMDFTKEKREESLVEPVDIVNREGIEISVERIVESFSNDGNSVSEASGTGDSEIANYPAVGSGEGSSTSERTEERINREVNRIYRQMELSPFVIDDITINVGVEPPNPENIESLTSENITDIENILKNVVSTSLSMNGTNLSEAELDDRISVFAMEFHGRPVGGSEIVEKTWFETLPDNALWMILGGLGLLASLLIIALVVRRRNREQGEEEEPVMEVPMDEPPAQTNLEQETDVDLSEFDTSNPKRKVIEKLAKERPEDFAKIIRSWMADD